MKTVLGGKGRVGSGQKMTVEMQDYGRSTHNKGKLIRTTMSPGTLVPIFTDIMVNGDTYDMNIDTVIKTLPTIGPLFGAFKAQIDVFTCPIRLYNGALHNNMLGVGMNMSKVMFPTIGLHFAPIQPDKPNISTQQVSPSSLIGYLGIKAGGWIKAENVVGRRFNGMNLLAYWDIYKNYYANKQENVGYVINATPQKGRLDSIEITHNGVTTTTPLPLNGKMLTIKAGDFVKLNGTGVEDIDQISFQTRVINRFDLWSLIGGNPIRYTEDNNGNIVSIEFRTNNGLPGESAGVYPENQFDYVKKAPELEKFPLENIDNMRKRILAFDNSKGASLEIETVAEGKAQPYKAAYWSQEGAMNGNMRFDQVGLGIKTYQSDRFNNWLSTEWIDGTNGINDITKVSTTEGSFKIDTLILAKKVYNMLNRVAVSGGSYEDWQESIYGNVATGKPESPIYEGGYSADIVFDEVVSSAKTEDNALGTLAGRGQQVDSKGGRLIVHAKEPQILMIIASITPRVDYSQGNKWYNGLKSMNDLHKPQLDGIGFQDLITEEMAALATQWDGNKWVQTSAGKQPAWIEWMTDTNEVFGEFAKESSQMFMTLNRNYEVDQTGIKDLTTYVDPSKFNYAFAEASLTAQNFWLHMGLDIEARRVMSAKVMPNL